ncbi:hypothetical protein FSP39_014111 [Pinctada imbricata]|uniref:G-protein coupled receptors family 1 profile domain-containing protein n=1 Tax=Pinctada imbricata TaxID=66713 RepID=A0AA88XRE8_PINIB|nr:hypothetical protein FSP39_014111 [Pinctada imbricata]
MVPFLEVVISSTSIFSILAISIERFRVVCKPLSTASYRISSTLRTIVCTWLLSIIISIPMFTITIYRRQIRRDGTPAMMCIMPINSSWKRCYVIVNYTLVYVVPVIVLFVLYSKVIKQLKASSANCLEFGDGYNCNQERHRIRRQVINIILCVVFVFFICHLPFRVISLVLVFGDVNEIRKITFENYLMLLYFSRCLLYANHALNPILYNFVSTKFRTAFKFLIFHGSRSGSERRNRSPGAYLPTPNQRIVFKRREQSTAGDNSSGSNKDKEPSPCSESQRRKDRTFQHTQRPFKETEENSRLLVAEDNVPCKWSEECIRLDVKDKPSAKVRFIMTPEGCVIGITLHKVNFEDKNVQTFPT